jgi:outer membrane biosynthesis protein TonB
MIPRSLVPFDARPSALEPTSRRRPSTLDDRTLVPSGLPVVPLEAKSNIPTNLPLEAIAERFVVPRDIKPEAYQVKEEKHALPPQPSEMDERITVPLGAASPEIIPPPTPVATDLVEKDIFLTGEVNFLNDEEIAKKRNFKNLLDRAYSVAIHVAIIALLIWPPKMFRKRPPTAEDQEIARKQMVLLLPPGAFETPRPEPRVVTPPPRVKVDPRVLREIAPPQPAPQPVVPQPKPEAKELPNAPTVQPNASQPPPPAAAPKTETPAKPIPRLETPDAPKTQPNLVLPKNSANPLRDTLQDLSRNSANRGGTYAAPDPRGRPPLGGGGRQGLGGPGIGMGPVQILTPTEGVDFQDYIQRVIASVRRNWYAVMPESAQLGDKGIVVLEFSIRRDGSVPGDDPDKLRGSGKEPLDRAAVSAIRSSNPFDHLPPAFTGPEIRLRFIFLYNLPVEAAYQ